MIASPCINVCKMDAQSGLCTGCLRTIDEITVWSRLDDRRRLDVLATIAKRRQQGHGKPPVVDGARRHG
jgi:predicted Fe-S protein YdhL (DUF1289 family)